MKLKDLFLDNLILPVISFVLVTIVTLVNKKLDFIKTKQLLIFILIASLLVGLPGLLSFFNISFVPDIYIYVQLVFIVAGYFYMQVFNGLMSHENVVVNRVVMLVCTLAVFFLGSYIFALLFNTFQDLSYGLSASTATYTLIIPLLFTWAFSSLNDIPAEINKVWRFNPQYREQDFTSETIDKLMVLEVELSKDPEETDIIKVKAKAPADMKFGDWFQMFIQDYNLKYYDHPIKFKNNEGELYGWIFYVKKPLFAGRKYLDPDTSIAGNDIAERNTISCKRVNKTYR